MAKYNGKDILLAVQFVDKNEATGEVEITENGTHNVKNYETAVVNVPIPDGYIKPSGSKTITENGTHDVAEYASVEVDVVASVQPTGEVTITENGTHDVTNYATAVVNVPTAWITVASVDDLPTDAPDGTIAIVG